MCLRLPGKSGTIALINLLQAVLPLSIGRRPYSLMAVGIGLSFTLCRLCGLLLTGRLLRLQPAAASFGLEAQGIAESVQPGVGRRRRVRTGAGHAARPCPAGPSIHAEIPRGRSRTERQIRTTGISP